MDPNLFRSQASCPICLDLFDDARFLSCGHTLCFSCAKDLPVKACPVCRANIVGDAEGLPKNFDLQGLVSMIRSFNLGGSSSSSHPPSPQTKKCEFHQKDLDVICLSCKGTPFICHLCVIDHHPQPSHSTKSVMAWSKTSKTHVDLTVRAIKENLSTDYGAQAAQIEEDIAMQISKTSDVFESLLKEIVTKNEMLNNHMAACVENNRIKFVEWEKKVRGWMEKISEIESLPEVRNSEDAQKVQEALGVASLILKETSEGIMLEDLSVVGLELENWMRELDRICILPGKVKAKSVVAVAAVAPALSSLRLPEDVSIKELVNIGLNSAIGAEFIKRSGQTFPKKDVYFAAIDQDPTFANAFTALGRELEPDETVELPDGSAMTKKQLFAHAIHLDANCSRAYNCLANELQDETFTLDDGRVMSKQQLYVEAIRSDPNFGFAYYNLAETISCVETVQLLNGRAVNKFDLLVEAIRCNKNDGLYFYEIARRIPAGRTVTLADGRTMGNRELFVEAARCNPKNSYVWSGLGNLLKSDEKIGVCGKAHTKRTLYLEAIKCDPTNIGAFKNLGILVGEKEKIKLHDGSLWTRVDLMSMK